MILNNKKIYKLTTFLVPITLASLFISLLFLPQYTRLGYFIFFLFFVSFVFFILSIFSKLRIFFSKRGTQTGLNNIITAIIVLGIVIAINFISNKHNSKFDFTRSKLNTLSDQSVKIIKNIQDEISFNAFIQEGPDAEVFKAIMKLYKYHNDKIIYKIIDPNKNPLVARAEGITQYGTVVVKRGDKSSKLDILEESAIINAIIKISKNSKKIVYFSTGHQEGNIDLETSSGFSTMKSLLLDQNYEVKKLNLFIVKEIPEDASVLIIAGAKKSFLGTEITKITNFMKKKSGSLLILADPVLPNEISNSKDSIQKIIDFTGVELRNDLIIETNTAITSLTMGLSNAMPVANKYDAVHKITEGFEDLTFYPYAQSINTDNVSPEYNVTELVLSTDTSVGIINAKSGKISLKNAKYNKGPLVMVAHISNVDDSKKDNFNLIIFGNSTVASNQYIVHASNADIVLNSVSFLIGDKDLISVRPKKDAPGQFKMPLGNTLPLLTVYFLPPMILIVGIIFWVKRRRS